MSNDTVWRFTLSGVRGIFIHTDNNGSVKYTAKEIQTEKFVIDCVNTNFAFFCIALNVLVICLYASMKKSMLKSPNFMLANQAVVDGVIGVLQLMYSFPSYLLSMPVNYHVFVNTFEKCTMYLALGILILGSAERLVALRHPFRHRTYVTIRKLMFATVLIWIASCAPILVQVVDSYTSSRSTERYVFCVENFFILVGIVVLISILIFTYRVIHRSIDFKINSFTGDISFTKGKISNPDKNSNTDFNAQRLKIIACGRKEDRKVFRIISLMAIFYTLAYLPILICNVVFDVVGSKNIGVVARYSAIEVTKTLYATSAWMNPIVILALKKDFRLVLKKYFKWMIKMKVECKEENFQTSKNSPLNNIVGK